jgi:threonyl-tRNA synthetase
MRELARNQALGQIRENMFVVPDEVPRRRTRKADPVLSGKADLMAIKPMNCPAHVLVFKQGITSYRDLPIRLGEMGCCHRNEPHGALHGLMRVRQFTQDDAHIFCTEEQVIGEVQAFIALADSVYRDFGFTYDIKLALRPEKRFGSDADWDKAEQELRDAVAANGLACEELPGEGAFYAPKLEWHLTDAIGRTWQVGTIQSDRVLPERLDANYIGEDGDKHRPVMLHRAIFGSYERFIGILIEHFAGRLPVWLAPVQAVVASIVSDADDSAARRAQRPPAAGVRWSICPHEHNARSGPRRRRHCPLLAAPAGRGARPNARKVVRHAQPDEGREHARHPVPQARSARRPDVPAHVSARADAEARTRRDATWRMTGKRMPPIGPARPFGSALRPARGGSGPRRWRAGRPRAE